MKLRQATFIEHLEELRRRIIYSLAVVAAAAIAAFFFSARMIDITLGIMKVETAYFFAPQEAFLARIKASLFMGGCAAFPFILIQAWQFIGPGLTQRERHVSVTFVLAGLALFAAGNCFAYFVLIPVGLGFFYSFGSSSIQPLMNVSQLLSFLFWCLLGCGLLFQVPLVVFTLVRLGIVPAKALRSHRPLLLVGLLTVVAAITPTGDMFTLLVVAVPLFGLLELSIALAGIGGGKPASPGD